MVAVLMLAMPCQAHQLQDEAIISKNISVTISYSLPCWVLQEVVHREDMYAIEMLHKLYQKCLTYTKPWLGLT